MKGMSVEEFKRASKASKEAHEYKKIAENDWYDYYIRFVWNTCGWHCYTMKKGTMERVNDIQFAERKDAVKCAKYRAIANANWIKTHQ